MIIAVTLVALLISWIMLPHVLLLLVGGGGIYALGRSHNRHKLSRATRKYINS